MIKITLFTFHKVNNNMSKQKRKKMENKLYKTHFSHLTITVGLKQFS